MKSREKFSGLWITANIFFVFISAVSGCISISKFAWLVGVRIVIASSAVELRSCAITTGVKKYKSIMKKKRTKHDKIMLLGKAKLSTIEVLLPKVLIDSYINSDEFVSVNNS